MKAFRFNSEIHISLHSTSHNAMSEAAAVIRNQSGFIRTNSIKDLGPLDFTGGAWQGVWWVLVLYRHLSVYQKSKHLSFISLSVFIERTAAVREVRVLDLTSHHFSTMQAGLQAAWGMIWGGRAPLFCSDWTDAFLPENLQKSFSTILYLFIAALAPAITWRDCKDVSLWWIACL